LLKLKRFNVGVFNVGDEIQQIEVSRLIAGNIDLEEVLDQRATRARRAGPLPTRYRLQPDELLRIHRNLGGPDEQLA